MRRFVIFMLMAVFSAYLLGSTAYDVEPNNRWDEAQVVPSDTDKIIGDVSPTDIHDYFFITIPIDSTLSMSHDSGDSLGTGLASWDETEDTKTLAIMAVCIVDSPVHYTLTLTSNASSLPVELSSFTCQVTMSNFVELTWITQSESDMIGYNVYRNAKNNLDDAVMQNGAMIPATNESYEHSYSFTDPEVEMDCTYWYWLESIENNGACNMHGPVSVTLTPPSDPEEEEVVDVKLTMLNPVYPNPFNPSVNISYYLDEASDVEVTIYNSRGQKIRSFDKGAQSEGNHSLSWNGLDQQGNLVGSGVYFFVMTAGNKTFVQKGIMLK